MSVDGLRRGWRAGILGLVLATGVAGAAGCATARDSAGGGDPERVAVTGTDEALAARVPDSIKADGKIVVGVDPALPPAEFRGPDAGSVVGFDIDLFNAVAAKLGLTVDYRSIGFDQIIPGVQANTYEAGVSSFTINAGRKGQALLVSYFQAGTQWATQTGNPQAVNPDDACGRKVAVPDGTAQLSDLTLRSKACVDAKKPAITVDPYERLDQAVDAVLSGKDDAVLADSPALGDAAGRSAGKLALLGNVYAAAPYGYVVGKDQQAFAEVLRDAVKAVIAEGVYVRILERWNVQGGALADAAVAINP